MISLLFIALFFIAGARAQTDSASSAGALECAIYQRSDDKVVCKSIEKYTYQTVFLSGDVDAFVGAPAGSGRYKLYIPASLISDGSDILNLDDEVVASLIKVTELPSPRWAGYEGTFRVLIVRLTDSGTNSSPSSTAWELGDNIFSSSGISLMERFASCSKNKFTIEKMTGSALTNGVLDVTSTIPLNGSDETCASQGEQLADSAISAGTIDSDDYDYVLVICPKNVDFGSAAAWAYMNYWLSVYEDQYSTVTSVQFHEVGHNINFMHSGTRGDSTSAEYDDPIATMGASYGTGLCFNAAKSYQTTWYKNGNVNPESSASLFTLTDINSWYNGATNTVAVKITGTGETPLYFSLTTDGDITTGFEPEASNYINKVNIVEQEDTITTGEQSWTVAQLGQGETYTKSNWASTGNTLTIKVCSIDVGSTNQAIVIVYLDGHNTITCGSNTPAPTVAPTTCTLNDLEVNVSVTTDGYPEENSWSIVSSSGATVSSETFIDAETTYTDDVCLDPSICHTFTFYDSYGDGLFTPGDFSLTVNGSVLFSNNGAEYYSLTTDFGNCSGSSTPAPTESPTVSPTTSPSVAPSPSSTSSSDCADSPFRFRLRKDGKYIFRDCSWVAAKSTNMRCKLTGVSSMCPTTCNACTACFDGENRFRLPWKGNLIFRDCVWVATKQTIMRCAVTGMTETCRSTCGSC